MSLSRILRGPGLSPSNEPSSAADSTVVHGPSVNSPLSDAESTPRANRRDLSAYNSPADSNAATPPGGSPNPFLLPPVGTPVTPPSYQSFFGDGPLTPPVLDSPTNNSRALRRHGAVALLVPQTPSTPNFTAPDSRVATGNGTPGATEGPGSLEGLGTPRGSLGAQVHEDSPESIGDGHGPGMATYTSELLDREAHHPFIVVADQVLTQADDGIIRPFQIGGEYRWHRSCSCCVLKVLLYPDIDFGSFTPTNAYAPESESNLLVQIDTKGISKAQFEDLIAFCSVCHMYMTRRSAPFHRGCQVGGSDSINSESESYNECATQTLLRLLTCGDPMGGLSEAQFCSLFSVCPRCIVFMTQDAARFHDCSEPLGKDSDVSDFEEGDREVSDFEEES